MNISKKPLIYRRSNYLQLYTKTPSFPKPSPLTEIRADHTNSTHYADYPRADPASLADLLARELAAVLLLLATLGWYVSPITFCSDGALWLADNAAIPEVFNASFPPNSCSVFGL